MNELPIHKREFHAFLSHAYTDKVIVDRINSWLSEVAGVPIWYDARYLQASAQIATELPKAIIQCRAMIIILSKTSVTRGWVREEYEFAIGQRTRFKDFRIVPVRIEECEVPGFLETTRWIDLRNGNLDLETANELLISLYYDDAAIESGKTRDIYVSRTWRESEAFLADYVSKLVDKAGFRLIGDSKDQAGFNEGDRIKSIISSCGGLVAILPDRGQGITSEYMLKEIKLAQDLCIPCLIVAESTVKLSDDLAKIAILMQVDEAKNGGSAILQTGIEKLMEDWKKPNHPHYIFFATDFNVENNQRNLVIKQLIQSVTAMTCIMGDKLREGEVQKVITETISRSFMMIADISEDNLNTLIEAGIARGANKKFHLIGRAPRRSPPFMFRDQQVWHYADNIELLGVIHRIAYLYRRRVLNYELPK